MPERGEAAWLPFASTSIIFIAACLSCPSSTAVSVLDYLTKLVLLDSVFRGTEYRTQKYHFRL